MGVVTQFSAASTKRISYKFDSAFPSVASNEEVYNQLMHSTILAIMEGRNATVFAYGPTGSGKTHSMLGPPDNSEPGLIHLTLLNLYAAIEAES